MIGGGCGGGGAGQSAYLLIVDDNVRALWVVDVGEWRAAVVERHLLHVLGLVAREAVEGDAERVERLELEALEELGAVDVERRLVAVLPRLDDPLLGEQVAAADVVRRLVLGAERRLDDEMRDALVVVLAHAAAHVVHELDAVGDRALVLLAEAGEAHKAAAHQLAVQRPLDLHHAAQRHPLRHAVVEYRPAVDHELAARRHPLRVHLLQPDEQSRVALVEVVHEEAQVAAFCLLLLFGTRCWLLICAAGLD